MPQARGIRLRLRPGLSEEGRQADPAPSLGRWAGSSARASQPPCAATARCSRPCSDQLRSLAKEADPQVTQLLTEAIDERMAKGEVLVAHLVGSGEQARVVDVERYLP